MRCQRPDIEILVDMGCDVFPDTPQRTRRLVRLAERPGRSYAAGPRATAMRGCISSVESSLPRRAREAATGNETSAKSVSPPRAQVSRTA